jgi:Protein of unknown function (DUF2796)
MAYRSQWSSLTRSLPWALLMAVWLQWTSILAPAAVFEQHRPHVHGNVTLNVAVDGTTLSIELAAPAINVVGFEHVPRTPDERAAVTRIATYLRGGRALIGVPPAADCRFVGTEYTEPQWEADSESEDHSRDADIIGHGHEHHADYEARFNFRCAHPAELAWFEPWLLMKLVDVTEAHVNIVTAIGQRSETVTSGRTRVELH